MKPKNIAVLMGGISSERTISLRSGIAVANALERAGYSVLRIDVKDKEIKELDNKDIDIAFIALHGYFGEDGGVQKLLESKGIPYTGSGVDASRLAMDKLASKERFIETGLKTPAYITVNSSLNYREVKREIELLDYPLVLKPTKNGSSIGVSLIHNFNDLQLTMEKLSDAGFELFIEKYIKGREFTVGILDGKTLPVIEVKPPAEFFDYDAKYTDSSVKYLMVKTVDEKDNGNGIDVYPYEGVLSPVQYRRVQKLAIMAHQSLGCKGFSRVDFLLDDHHEFNLLEVNTIPGFTEKSLLPMAARAAGVNFSSLCKKIINSACHNLLVAGSK